MDQGELIQWAESRIKAVRFWSMLGWSAHNCLTAVSIIIAVGLPVCLGLMLYFPPTQYRALNIWMLCASAIGAVTQVLNSVLRLRERSIRGRRNTNHLEAELLRYRQNAIHENEFFTAVSRFLEEDYQEEGP
jgi:hypothetical protein